MPNFNDQKNQPNLQGNKTNQTTQRPTTGPAANTGNKGGFQQGGQGTATGGKGGAGRTDTIRDKDKGKL